MHLETKLFSKNIVSDADENFGCNQSIKYYCQPLNENRRIKIVMLTTLRL
jgi:hypothetical protein